MNKLISIQDKKMLVKAIDILIENGIELETVWAYDAIINEEVSLAISNLSDKLAYTSEEIALIEDIYTSKMQSNDYIIDSKLVAHLFEEAIKEFNENRRTIA